MEQQQQQQLQPQLQDVAEGAASTGGGDDPSYTAPELTQVGQCRSKPPCGPAEQWQLEAGLIRVDSNALQTTDMEGFREAVSVKPIIVPNFDLVSHTAREAPWNAPMPPADSRQALHPPSRSAHKSPFYKLASSVNDWGMLMERMEQARLHTCSKMELENFQQEVEAHRSSLDTLWIDRGVLSEVGEAQVEAQQHRVNMDLRFWNSKIMLLLADFEKSSSTALEVDSNMGGPSAEAVEAAAATAAKITCRERGPAARQQQVPSSSWADEVEREWPPNSFREGGEGWGDSCRRGGREEDGEDHNYVEGGSQDLPIKRLVKLADREDKTARLNSSAAVPQWQPPQPPPEQPPLQTDQLLQLILQVIVAQSNINLLLSTKMGRPAVAGSSWQNVDGSSLNLSEWKEQIAVYISNFYRGQNGHSNDFGEEIFNLMGVSQGVGPSSKCSQGQAGQQQSGGQKQSGGQGKGWSKGQQQSGGHQQQKGQGKGRVKGRTFVCRVPFCVDSVPHGKAVCGVFQQLSVSARWDVVLGLGSCMLCLKHASTVSCNQANSVGGTKVCGVQGCKEAHHPLLHGDSALSVELEVTPRFRCPEAVEAIPRVVQKNELVEDGSRGGVDSVQEFWSPLKSPVGGKMVDPEVEVLPFSEVVPGGRMVEAKVVEAPDNGHGESGILVPDRKRAFGLKSTELEDRTEAGDQEGQSSLEVGLLGNSSRPVVNLAALVLMQPSLKEKLAVLGKENHNGWTGSVVDTVDWREAVEASLKSEASPEGSDWWQDLSAGQSAYLHDMEDAEDGAKWTMKLVEAAGCQEAVETGLRFKTSPEGQDWWQDLSGGQSAHRHGMEDVGDGAGAAERAWNLLQERRRAARGSKKRTEAVEVSLNPEVSSERLGGGQDLSEVQSALLTDMEDAENQWNIRKRPEAVGISLKPHASREEWGGGQHLSKVQSALPTDVEDAEGKVISVRQEVWRSMLPRELQVE